MPEHEQRDADSPDDDRARPRGSRAALAEELDDVAAVFDLASQTHLRKKLLTERTVGHDEAFPALVARPEIHVFGLLVTAIPQPPHDESTEGRDDHAERRVVPFVAAPNQSG